MIKHLKILFCPLNMVGPINASIGIGEVLRNSGHKVVFAIGSEWTGKLTIHGFDEEVIGQTISEQNDGSAKKNAQDLKSLLGPESRVEKLKKANKVVIKQLINEVIENDSFLEEIVNRIKPDVIFCDTVFEHPSFMNSRIPWVLVMTCNPLIFDWAIEDDRLPPSSLGLPTNGDKKEWKKLREDLNESLIENWNLFNNWIVSKGLASLPKCKFFRCSPYLNIYMFPEELDYIDIRQLPANFHRFDCFKRTGSLETFELPDKLGNKSGKLIYLSMGSMGSANVELMKRLVAILSKSKHRFIVSKGPFHDEYELADNMWGHRYVPQIKVLPIVDLIITHGGNNTLTEMMYFGKPFLVMPLFFDQFDNAQRLVEKGLSIELNPFECTQTQLFDSIEKLLNDKILAQRLTSISQKVQNQQNILKIIKLTEDLVK